MELSLIHISVWLTGWAAAAQVKSGSRHRRGRREPRDVFESRLPGRLEQLFCNDLHIFTGGHKVHDIGQGEGAAVSYTHLDVYKRQAWRPAGPPSR